MYLLPVVTGLMTAGEPLTNMWSTGPTRSPPVHSCHDTLYADAAGPDLWVKICVFGCVGVGEGVHVGVGVGVGE